MTVFLLREGGATAAAGQPVLAVVRAFEAFPGRTERLHHIHNLGEKKKKMERGKALESLGEGTSQKLPKTISYGTQKATSSCQENSSYSFRGRGSAAMASCRAW